MQNVKGEDHVTRDNRRVYRMSYMRQELSGQRHHRQHQGKHVVDSKLCIDCGLCGRLCPKSAIKDAQGQTVAKLVKDKWEKPVIDQSACVGCSVCAENCPTGCLEICAPRFHGDIRTIAELARPDDCIGCHICGRVCPIDAISYKSN